MSATLPAAVLDTILARLALLFLAGAGGDIAAARLAALQMLTRYHPETEDEFRLAAQIVTFSFHALEALSQAATPDMPLTRILRLRSSAVSLSRESHKAERRLDQLKKARRDGIPSQPTATEPHTSSATVEKALELIADTRAVADAANKPTRPGPRRTSNVSEPGGDRKAEEEPDRPPRHHTRRTAARHSRANRDRSIITPSGQCFVGVSHP